MLRRRTIRHAVHFHDYGKLLLTFVAFWSLVAITAATAERRAFLRSKPMREWALDVVGLVVQGMLVPVAGVA